MMRLSALRSRYRVAGNPLQLERRVELVAVVVSLLLLLQILYSVLRLGFLSGPEAIAPSLDFVAAGPEPVVQPVDPALSEEIRSRPLFWSSRRPLEIGAALQEEVAEDQSTGAGELDKVRLVGIFGDGDTAGIITLVGEKQRRIHVGEEIEGWTLDRVARDRAILRNSGRTQELMLKPTAIQGGDTGANQKSTRKSTAMRDGETGQESTLRPPAMQGGDTGTGQESTLKPRVRWGLGKGRRRESMLQPPVKPGES